ncbi:MAG: hypothetical protein FWJ62_05885 [Thermaerobacter sp.]
MGGRWGAAAAALAVTALLLAAARQAVFTLVPAVEAGPAEVPVTSHGQALLGYEEHVLVAPVGGTLERQVAEGARVARGTPVARIAAGGGAGPEELQALTLRLSELREAILPGADQEAAAGAEAVASELARLRQGLEAGRGDAAPLWRAYRAWNDARERRERLQQEAARLEARLEELRRLRDAGTALLRAPVSGTVTFAADGLEDLLDGERFLETAPALLLGGDSVPIGLPAAAVGPPQGAASPVQDGAGEAAARPVAAGQVVARILDSWTAHVALPVPAEAVRRGWVAAGERIQWEVDGRPVAADVISIIPAAGDRAVAVGRVAVGLPVLMPRRTVPFTYTWGALSGQAVPPSALVESAGGAWVAVVEARGVRWARVMPVARDDRAVLVEGIEPGTRVLRVGRLGFWLTWDRPG